MRDSPPAASDTDVQTPEALLRAFYESNSGQAHSQHDWARFGSLFLAGARIVAVSRDSSDRVRVRPASVEEYIAAATPYLEQHGFEERELACRMSRYGNVVQAWSTYEAHHGPAETPAIVRGINSFQLAFADGRWWIAHLLWTNERTGGPIPSEYLEMPGPLAPERDQ